VGNVRVRTGIERGKMARMTLGEINEPFGGLPREYWPCPLCLMTLLEAHGSGTVHHQAAFEALMVSGLVENWPENPGFVRTTERGTAFVEMLLATPLPEQKWIDPREPVVPVKDRSGK
jgi:hypothetical protein